MDETPDRQSHAWTWILSFLVGVPVLYFLSLGPVTYYHTIHKLEKGYYKPSWKHVYLAPANWLSQHTPLNGIVDPYAEWWYQLAKSHYQASHPSPKPPR